MSQLALPEMPPRVVTPSVISVAWNTPGGENCHPVFPNASEEWATPQNVYDSLNAEFGFTLDVCATDTNAKAPRYYTKAEDGLAQPWHGVVWCNPPYGNEIGAWLARAVESVKSGSVSAAVFLIPSRTDVAWWHTYVPLASEVRFIRGRLKFGGSPNSAPFPSCIIVFRREEHPTHA